MSIHTIVDSLPRVLYRTFADADLKYAHAFAHRGELRVSEIETYRGIGGEREDMDESTSFALVPGMIPTVFVNVPCMKIVDSSETAGHFNQQTSFRNPTYISCFSKSDANVTEIRRRFGRWSVAIRSTEVFVERIAAAFSNFTKLEIDPDFLEAFPVQYNRGDVLTAAQLEAIGVRLHYGQKSSEFSCESEYRIAAIYGGVRSELPKHATLHIEMPAGIYEILDLQKLRALPDL